MFHQIYDMKNNSFKEIWRELKKSKNILLFLHPSPDGDSLGSCTAMKYVLEKRGIKIKLISKDPLSENLEFYNFSKEVEFGTDIENIKLDDFDHIIFLDYNYSTSEPLKEKLKDKIIIDIDHHTSNSYYGNLNYVDANAPSCCSILFEFFKKVRVHFDKELALRLLVGICTDTSFFIYNNSLDSMEKAIYLLKLGKIDYKRDLYEPIMGSSWGLKKLHGIIISNMKKEEINGKTVVYSWALKKDYKKLNINGAEIRLGITCLNNLKEGDLIFTLTESEGEIKGSFRSKNLDTIIYSSAMNGGGHKLASGFTIKTTNMKEAIEKVLNIIKEKGFVEV